MSHILNVITTPNTFSLDFDKRSMTYHHDGGVNVYFSVPKSIFPIMDGNGYKLQETPRHTTATNSIIQSQGKLEKE